MRQGIEALMSTRTTKSKSSSVAGVNRRERHKSRLHRRRLGVPAQLTLFLPTDVGMKTRQAVRRKA
ncbi:hypothetical protein FJZ31_34555 [Candidatus Poribacteria bacterium]|nr:hypothetical protein [Candidatus Poribacteria bacterium]